MNLPTPKNDHEFAMWVGMILLSSLIYGIGWLGKKVYPKWVQKQEELEDLRTESITRICNDMSKSVIEHGKREEKVLEQISEKLTSISTNQESILKNLEMERQLRDLKTQVAEMVKGGCQNE